MSPAAAAPEHFLAQFGRRPIEHLADLGVLGPNTVITHCVHVDENEIGLLAEHGCSVAHCPPTALKVSHGATPIGRMPHMAPAGVDVPLGLDGNNDPTKRPPPRAPYPA